jgi:hypothetical protein
LEFVGLGNHFYVFNDNEIDMDRFFWLRDEQLRMLLPGKLGAQLKMLRLIQDANLEWFPPVLIPTSQTETTNLVKEYLESIGQGQYLNVFEDNEIGPEEFLELTLENLEELLPENLGARMSVFGLIQALNAQQETSEEGPEPDGNDQQQNNSDNSMNDEALRRRKKKALIKKGLIIGGVGLGTAVVAVAAAPLVIAGVGFGAAGVAAGSLAAAWQSAIGSVVAGSLFASLQSAGAVGLAAGTSAAIAATTGTVAAAGTAGIVHLASRSDEEKIEQENVN